MRELTPNTIECNVLCVCWMYVCYKINMLTPNTIELSTFTFISDVIVYEDIYELWNFVFSPI